MKKYIVPEDFLLDSRFCIEEFASHTINCSFHFTEFCDCGFSQYLKNLKKLSTNIIEYKEK